MRLMSALFVFALLTLGSQAGFAQEEDQRPPPPPEGRHHHPDPARRKAMHDCLAAKGIDLPKPEKGQRPNFSEEARAAMKECREQLESSSKSSASPTTDNPSGSGVQ